MVDPTIPASLFEVLHAADLSEVELRELLTFDFPSGSYQGGDHVDYSSEAGVALSLVYKNGTVVDIVRGPAMDDHGLAELVSTVVARSWCPWVPATGKEWIQTSRRSDVLESLATPRTIR